MRTRSLILLVPRVTLSGCIVTYRDFPNATLESLPKNHEAKPLYYHVDPILMQNTPFGIEQSEWAKWSGRFKRSTILTLFPGWYAFVPQIDPIGQPGYEEVVRTLRASGMLSDLIEAPDVPATGVYCHIGFYVRARTSPWLVAYFFFSIQFIVPAVVNLLPYYAGEGGTTVMYSLYRDGRLQQIYDYPITKQGAGWVVLLPFVWLNFFTNDLKDAVHGTTFQFLIDAQRDGNL